MSAKAYENIIWNKNSLALPVSPALFGELIVFESLLWDLAAKQIRT